MVAKKIIVMRHVSTTKMLADGLTKPLPEDRHGADWAKLGLNLSGNLKRKAAEMNKQ